MGRAAKLCLDHDAIPGLVGDDIHFEVAARLPAGATLVLRSEPDKNWKVEPVDHALMLGDGSSYHLPIAIGDGQPAVEQLERAAIEMLAPDGVAPTVVTEAHRATLRGDLNNLLRDGKGWCVFLGAASGQAASDSIRRWAGHNRVTLITLTQADRSAVFLWDEDLLIGRIKHFILLFDDKEWPPS
jgi:hypothetical protein